VPRILVAAAAALAVAVLLVLAGLVVHGDEPGPPLGAVLDGSDRHALDAAPLRRGPAPPPADPAVDLEDPAAVGVVVLDPPPPGQVRTAAVTALDLVAATEDDRRRGYRATVATSTGPVTATVTTAYVVLARQPDGRWLVVVDAPDLLEGDD